MKTEGYEGLEYQVEQLVRKRDALKAALECAIGTLKNVKRDTYYAFEPDGTPEHACLIPTLEAALNEQGEKV